jgi:hypothetical protein
MSNKIDFSHFDHILFNDKNKEVITIGIDLFYETLKNQNLEVITVDFTPSDEENDMSKLLDKILGE